MVLKAKRGGGRKHACVARCFFVQRRPEDLRVVLHHDAVEDRRDRRRLNHLAALQLRRVEDDVVGLPFTRLAHRIHQRGRLPVDTACHPIRVGQIVVAIEDLRLVAIHEKNTGVALLLRAALGARVGLPFQMQLTARETLLRPHIAALDDQLAVLERPGTRRSVFAPQPVGVRPVEEHDRVGRRGPGRTARIDRSRARAVDVMHFPWAARHNQGRVSIARRIGIGFGCGGDRAGRSKRE